MYPCVQNSVLGTFSVGHVWDVQDDADQMNEHGPKWIKLSYLE